MYRNNKAFDEKNEFNSETRQDMERISRALAESWDSLVSKDSNLDTLVQDGVNHALRPTVTSFIRNLLTPRANP